MLGAKDQSILSVADILVLGGIKGQVADGSNQRINTHRQIGEDEVSPRSGGKAFGLEGGVVDDDATDEAEEKGQQKANEFVVIHSKSPCICNDDSRGNRRRAHRKSNGRLRSILLYHKFKTVSRGRLYQPQEKQANSRSNQANRK